MKYMRLLIALLIIPIMISGCSSKQDVALQNSDQKILVESFIDYYNKGDADSVIGLLSKDIVTEQKLGDQESKSTDVKSMHESIKHNILWKHNIKILKWTNTSGDIISVQIEESGDEYKMIGIDTVRAEMTFEIKDGKIIKIRTVIDKSTVDQMISKANGGIGVKIEVSPNFITINEIAPGLPADKAGLKKGDMITAIDGINCSAMREGEGILRLRGPINSKVTLTISRGGDEKPFDIVVVREDLSKAAGN
ncbi:MAG: PDZ domain-containing protein [Actinobacteria bacterium]|nr:PDZ domain-containing protein [Actinomycetota bacterium]